MAKHTMKGFDSLLPYKEALSVFDSEQWHMPGITEKNLDNAAGKISCENIFSPLDIPGQDKSAMDGYAVRSSDTLNATSRNPAKLALKGINAAGDPVGNPVGTGQCTEIYTGSLIPPGADAVVRAENTEVTEGYVYVYAPVVRGGNISVKGEDIARGSLILEKNSIIRPQNLAAAKSAGIHSVKAYNDLAIGIINTGREILNGQIENSTGMLLRTFYDGNYTVAIDGGIVDDDKESIRDRLNSLIEKCHIVIITGGSSLGKRDMTTEALSEEGRPLFSGVAIKPGRTMAIFNVKNRPVISVSGLPVAALISSIVFVNRYIQNAFGVESALRVNSLLDENIRNKTGFTSFQIAKTYAKNGELHSVPLKTTASGMISALIRGNSLIRVDENREGIEEGSHIIVYLMGDIKWD
jgi:molybdopterin molybdotransferase